MELVDKGPLCVVGIEVVAPWKELWTRVPEAWLTLRARADEIRHRTSDVFIEVSVDERDGVHTQVIGAAVASLDEQPAGMVRLEIPAQRYLHHRHEGGLGEIAAAFGAMYDWARSHDCALDAFKLDIGYARDGGENAHDLYIRAK